MHVSNAHRRPGGRKQSRARQREPTQTLGEPSDSTGRLRAQEWRCSHRTMESQPSQTCATEFSFNPFCSEPVNIIDSPKNLLLPSKSRHRDCPYKEVASCAILCRDANCCPCQSRKDEKKKKNSRINHSQHFDSYRSLITHQHSEKKRNGCTTSLVWTGAPRVTVAAIEWWIICALGSRVDGILSIASCSESLESTRGTRGCTAEEARVVLTRF